MTAIEWVTVGCCGMKVRPVPAAPELISHPSGVVLHRSKVLCGYPADYIAEPKCRTCCDTGVVVRRETSAVVPCPSHCEAGWERVHLSVDYAIPTRVDCFFDCGHIVRSADALWAHDVMETHYDSAHRELLDRLVAASK